MPVSSSWRVVQFYSLRTFDAKIAHYLTTHATNCLQSIKNHKSTKRTKPKKKFGCCDKTSEQYINHTSLFSLMKHNICLCKLGSFPFVPPSKLCTPKLQSTRRFTVNHKVKIWHVRLGWHIICAHQAGGKQTEKIRKLMCDEKLTKTWTNGPKKEDKIRQIDNVILSFLLSVKGF